MGRGRSKAKQTKVARDLKYSNKDMDLESLAIELHSELSARGSNQNNDPYSEDKDKPRD